MNEKRYILLKEAISPFIDPSFFLTSRTHAMRAPGLFVKRDDELNFGISGSKLRKYASILPYLEGLKKPVALTGSPYSNHVLGLLQLLKQRNIPYHLFLDKAHIVEAKGNFFFLSLLTEEKEITWQTPSTVIPKEFFPIPLGGYMEQALPGALTLPLDLKEVIDKNKIKHIFVDSGTGTNAAALVLGLHYLEADCDVTIVSMAGEENTFTKALELFLPLFRKLTGEDIAFPHRFSVIPPATSKSFGSCNQTVLKEIIKTAKEEGIFVDPIYTAKLLFTVRKHNTKDNTLWIHSGGALSLTGFQEELLRIL